MDKTLLFVFILLLTISCKQQPSKTKTDKINSTITNVEVENIPNLNAFNTQYQNNDFDGDSINDSIYFKFTGGAHCCHLIQVWLSSKDSLYKYPFNIDGGVNIFNVNNEIHQQFEINDFDNDSLPEIFMTIASYNGKLDSIPTEWKNEFDIKTNYIMLDYKNGTMQVFDYQK